MRHASFKEILKDSWLSPAEGSVRSTLYIKLKRLKTVLRDFNKNFYSGISTKVAHAREELTQFQSHCSQNPCDLVLTELERDLYLKFIDLSLAEESFKKQKSRVQWLALGDQNTKFFHLKMKTHCLRNKILSLTIAKRMRLTDSDDVKNEILGYYLGLLGSPFAQSRSAYQSLRVAIPQRLSVVMKTSLV